MVSISADAQGCSISIGHPSDNRFVVRHGKGGVRLGRCVELGVISIAGKLNTKFPEDIGEG